MTVEVIGFQKKHFTAQDGAVISGYNIFVAGSDAGITGNYAERIFVSDSKLAGYVPALGDQVRIDYNRYGKVAGVEVVHDA